MRQVSKSLVEVKKKGKKRESGVSKNSGEGGELQLTEEELLVCTKCGAAGQTGSVGRMGPLSGCKGKVPARELERVLKAAHDSALFPVSWRLTGYNRTKAIRCSLLMLNTGGRAEVGKV